MTNYRAAILSSWDVGGRDTDKDSSVCERERRKGGKGEIDDERGVKKSIMKIT